MEYKTIFEIGEKITGEEGNNFNGTAYLKRLVPSDSGHDVTISNVTFEPGCRNSWHTHPGGQILLVTEGEGWYQEEGKDVMELLPGTVVIIPADTRHWHGAKKDSFLDHIAISTKISLGPCDWQEPITHYDEI